MTDLASSFAHCEAVARRRAGNFYYSFLALPRDKKRAMCVLYAFMRECDDRSDGEGASRERLAEWRGQLDVTLGGAPAAGPVWPALLNVVRRYCVPGQCLHEMIDGVSSDLEPRRIGTFDELYRYCYRVASVVGIATIHVFGFHDPAAPVLAEKCGIAFQLTNILRDVREDALNGRVYLPVEDLARFGVHLEMLSAGRLTDELRHLLEFEAGRARRYYEQSRPLLDMVSSGSRGALWALIEIYRRLLGRIEQRGYDVMQGRIRLPWFEKSAIAARAIAGWTG